MGVLAGMKDIVRNIAKNEPEWLVAKRLQALELYQKQEMPRFVYGIGIFASAIDFSSALSSIHPAPDDEIMHDPSIKVLSLAEASRTYPEAKGMLADPTTGKFASLHQAFFNNSLVIIAPKHVCGTVKIHTILRQTRVDNILVIAEEGSTLVITMTETADSIQGKMFQSQQVQILAKEKSTVTFISSQDHNEETYHFSNRYASLGKDAALTWVDFTLGSRFSQVNTTTALDAEGASCKNWGACFGSNMQQFDIHASAIHNASHSSSDMLLKAVLDKQAKTIYRGLIRIPLGSSGCNGYQKDDTLLLSDKAEADTLPDLEISNNEVRCSHGATISNLNPEQLFYMTSRGMDEAAAKQMLIEGFLEPIISKLKDERMENQLRQAIIQKMAT